MVIYYTINIISDELVPYFLTFALQNFKQKLRNKYKAA